MLVFVILPTNLQQDRWVQVSEARPGNRAVVHHAVALVRTPESAVSRLSCRRSSRQAQTWRQEANQRRRPHARWIHPRWIRRAVRRGSFQPGVLLQGGERYRAPASLPRRTEPARDRTGSSSSPKGLGQNVFNFGIGNASFVILPALRRTVWKRRNPLTMLSCSRCAHASPRRPWSIGPYILTAKRRIMRVPRASLRWQHNRSWHARRCRGGHAAQVTRSRQLSNNPDNPDLKRAKKERGGGDDDRLRDLRSTEADAPARLLAARESGGVLQLTRGEGALAIGLFRSDSNRSSDRSRRRRSAWIRRRWIHTLAPPRLSPR
jgi:hypothetical protein